MYKKLFSVYKLQLLLSITVAVTLIAITVLRTPVNLVLISIASIAGTFVLDLDYIIYAYFLDPDKPFSKTLRGYLNSKDFSNAISHIYYNRSDVKEKTLNSVLFQIVLAGVNLIVLSSTSNIFFKAFTLSVFVNSIYKMTDYYFDGKAEEWFWELKNAPDKKSIILYTIVLIISIIYGLSLI